MVASMFYAFAVLTIDIHRTFVAGYAIDRPKLPPGFLLTYVNLAMTFITLIVHVRIDVVMLLAHCSLSCTLPVTEIHRP